MTAAIHILVWALFAPLLVFWGLWFMLALVAPRRWVYPHTRNAAPEPAPDPTVKIDVLIPAHNEQLLLPKLLRSLRVQTAPEVLGNVLVIADFCDDRTAEIARAHGCEVLERNSGPRGKPGALRLGIHHLLARYRSVPDPGTTRALLFMDADCTAFPDLLAAFANALLKPSADGTTGRPIQQSAYLLESPDALPLHAPARLAFLLKNVVRPAGLEFLRLPCQLFGTGMLIRCDVLDRLTFADDLTEDLRLAHDLLVAGLHAHYTPRATVDSPFPADTAAMTKQKLRWEGGQFHAWRALPRLAAGLLRRGRFGSVISLLDWSAPPVALGALAWMALTVLSLAAVVAHLAAPWVLLAPAIAVVFLAGYITVGILKIAGPAGLIQLALHAPRFLFWKITVYAQMLARGGPRSWDRTPREAGAPALATTGRRPNAAEDQWERPAENTRGHSERAATGEEPRSHEGTKEERVVSGQSKDASNPVF